MIAQVTAIHDQDQNDSVTTTASADGCSDRLAGLDPAKLRKHIHSLEQKLAHQKAKNSPSFLDEQQLQQLLALLDKESVRDSQVDQLQALADRAGELNQRSEQIQQDIQGLNIVSENATNKCYEITYGAQHVIDQNEKLQKNLNQQLDRSVNVNEQCNLLVDELTQSIERTGLTQQKMDSATDRAHSMGQKSTQLLEDLHQCKQDIIEQIDVVHQATEDCSRSNAESEILRGKLGKLSETIESNTKEHRQHVEAGNIVLANCEQLSKDVTESRKDTQRVLDRVLADNNESKELIGTMTGLLQTAEEKQQQNRSLNLDLQHSLQSNLQQREELIILTSECREIRDQSLETQQHNAASISDALKKLSVALAETRQGKLQVERVLKEVFEGNRESQELIGRMTELIQVSDSKQEENSSLNSQLRSVLEQSTATRNELVELVESSRIARDKTESVLETSLQINNDSQSSISKLNEYMDSMCETREELNELISTSQKVNEDASESLDAMRTNINNSTMIQKECMRLNKESVTTTLDAKRTSEKLTEQLESSFKLNKHYQDRMKAAEKKFQSAVEAERKYQELHESSLKALHDNESLLEQAQSTMKEYSDNSVEYNNSIKQFQQINVQSQQIILETQASIKTLIGSNVQFAAENRFLKRQLQKREPTSPDNVWPALESELLSDSALTNGFDSKLENLNQCKEDWQLK